MEYLKRLKTLKEEKGLTNAEIAEISAVPLATVTRIFNGSTPNPQFDTIARITIALGGSLDLITGITTPNEQLPSRVESVMNSYADLLKSKDELIHELQADKRHSRRLITKLTIFISVFVAAVLFVLIFDMLNGHFGYFRY